MYPEVLHMKLSKLTKVYLNVTECTQWTPSVPDADRRRTKTGEILRMLRMAEYWIIISLHERHLFRKNWFTVVLTSPFLAKLAQQQDIDLLGWSTIIVVHYNVITSRSNIANLKLKATVALKFIAHFIWSSLCLTPAMSNKFSLPLKVQDSGILLHAYSILCPLLNAQFH